MFLRSKTRRKDGKLQLDAFAAIRPCLSTLRKRFVDPYQALVMTFPGNPPMPRQA